MTARASFEHAARLHQAGDLARAEQGYLATLALDPAFADAWSNLGAVRAALGNPADAIRCYQEALRAQPRHPGATFNLGVNYQRLGQPAEALTWFEAARALNAPSDQLAAYVGYVLADLGRDAEAAASLQEYLGNRPNDARAWHRLGHVCTRLQRDADALAAFEKAVALAPNTPDVHTSLGTFLHALGRADEAVARYREALRVRPDNPEAANNLGNTYVEAGRTAEAIPLLRAAVAGRPQSAAIHSNLLLALNYRPEIGPDELLAEHRAWAARHADPLTPKNAPPTTVCASRALRIGYLSADFRRHPVAAYIGPVLATHDRSAVHVTCYSASPRPDEITERLRASADAWRDICGLSDAAIADAIRQDRIDVLIDLGGHTAGNRLLVLARRPAAVQAVHFGYPNTTGMHAVDFRITDAVADPPGSDQWYVERLVRLPAVGWCWRPPPETPDVGTLPYSQNAFITFGSLNNPAKVTEEVAAVWARVLQRVPGSKLLLLTGQLAETRDRYLAEFARLGIEPGRLRLEPRQAPDRYYALWGSVDIGLDPFAYNGGVTTPDALWMGVPVVALAGASCRARQGLCVLGAVGLGDWVAATAEEYVERAVQKAADPTGLADVRASLRDRLLASPLLDVPGFVRHLEDAYLRMCVETTNR